MKLRVLLPVAAVLAIVALTLNLQSAPVAAQDLRVTPLPRNGRVFVSFTLADAFDDDVRAAIRSGLPTTFTYEVSLMRAVSLWFDRTIAEATVSATVRYDNLTRRYQVTRMINGRVESTPQVTDNEDTVRSLMTEFDRLPLFDTADLEVNAEYYLRVRARTSPRNAWFIWPWGRHRASGRATFTFIQ
jgi:hypothetical protein